MDNKLRKENVVWTVSEDYSYIPILNLFDDYGDYDMDYYKMMLLGCVYKLIDMDKFLDFMSICMEKTELKDEYLKLVEIFLDDVFSDILLEERAGAYDYKKKFLDKISDKYTFLEEKYKEDFLKKLSVEEEIEYVYYSLLDYKFVQGRGVVEELSMYLRRRTTELTKLADSLSKAIKLQDSKRKVNTLDLNEDEAEIVDSLREELTDELINVLNGAFLKFFYQNVRREKSKDDDKDFKKDGKDKDKSKKKTKEKERTSRLNFKMKKKHIDKAKDTDGIGMFSVESAEFTGQIPDDIKMEDERLKSNLTASSRASNDKIKDMLLARYGESIYPENLTNFIESKLCTDIHQGIKFHFTKGNFIEGKYDKYFANSIKNQREKNIEYYKDNELIFRRSINELKEILRKKIFLEDDDSAELTRSGELVVSQIWKNKILGDEKIFKKVNKDELGSLSVDILLDSSASQIEREELVSAQAYIIAEALTSLKIPTRVFGFCNFFNFLVMTEYRDYRESQSANKRIFNYKASGSNRDGLAIKFLSKQMETLEEDNKVLIVLSDGKPNDKIDLGTVGFMKVDGEDYEGEEAIKDTAQEVFNAKMRSNNVLGVFTGEDEDLDAEKKIYGKDFAYIKNLSRFSHIIGFYLEQLLD